MRRYLLLVVVVIWLAHLFFAPKKKKQEIKGKKVLWLVIWIVTLYAGMLLLSFVGKTEHYDFSYWLILVWFIASYKISRLLTLRIYKVKGASGGRGK